MNILQQIQPSVCLVHEQRVKFTPKLLHNDNGVKYENSGFFWKHAIFEVVIDGDPILPDVDAPSLSKVVWYIVVRYLNKFNTTLPLKVFIQIFQQVTPPAERDGPLIYNKTEYETGWICKVHLPDDLVEKIKQYIPQGFTYDLTLSNVSISPVETNADKKCVADIVTRGNVHATPEFHSNGNVECGPTVKLSQLDRHTHSCIRVAFKMPHALESNPLQGQDFLELDKRGVLNDQTFEGTLSLQIRVDSSAQLTDYDSDDADLQEEILNEP